MIERRLWCHVDVSWVTRPRGIRDQRMVVAVHLLRMPRQYLHCILMFVGMLVVGCGDAQTDSASPEVPLDSHERMAAQLRAVLRDTPQTNKYLGDAELKRLVRQLGGMKVSEPAIQRMMLLANIGNAELSQGKNRDAVKRLTEALALSSAARDFVPPERQGEFGRICRDMMLDLGVAWLRVAETENCLHCQTGESCILPIGPGGLHRQPEGTRESMKVLTSLLTQEPENYSARWLLNVAAMTVGEYPEKVPEPWRISPSVFQSQSSFPKFANIAAGLGLDTVDLSGGVIIEDFDNDGWLDIVTSTWDTSSAMHYFRNNGDGSFTDRTREAGLTDSLGGLNMIQADYDNDGNTDIFVLRGAWLEENGRHPNSLLRNIGGGKFRDVTYDAGLVDPALPTHSAAWSDFDNDGDLDLFVGVEEIAASQLFENSGDGKFVDIAAQAGLTNDRFVRGCVWGDYDHDRRPDLYVSNLYGENRLYHNEADGKFTDVAVALGVQFPSHSFPAWFWDCNNDGRLDLFVSSYSGHINDLAEQYFGQKTAHESPALFLGDTDGGFRNVSVEYGLDCVALTMGANFGDVDSDGYPDFYLGTGYPQYEGIVPNMLFRNKRGAGFENVTFAAGMGHLQKGHGVSMADLDHDGDLDVFIQLGGAYKGDVFPNALFRNPGFGNHWLCVRLIGQQSNRSAIGAQIRAVIDDGEEIRSVYRHVSSGGSFGANPLRSYLGLGQATSVQTLEIYWPTSDTTQTFRDVAVDQFVEITEGQQELQRRAYTTAPFDVAPISPTTQSQDE
jgi:hypothetical protein